MYQTSTWKGHTLVVIEPAPKGNKFGGVAFGVGKAKAILAEKDNINAFLRGAEIEGRTSSFVSDRGKNKGETMRSYTVHITTGRGIFFLRKAEDFWRKVMAKIEGIAEFVKDHGDSGSDEAEAA